MTTARNPPNRHPAPESNGKIKKNSNNIEQQEEHPTTRGQQSKPNPRPHRCPSCVSRSAQDTADIAHAMLADLVHGSSDEDLDDNDSSGRNNGNAYEAASTSRYAAILSAGPGRFWTKRTR